MRKAFLVMAAAASLVALAEPQRSAGAEARPQAVNSPDVQAFRDRRAKENRLATVFHRVAAAAAGRCAPDARSSLGLSLRSVAFFPDAERAVAERLFGVDDHVFVEHVIPGFPGEKAGVAVGDRIISIGGRDIGRGASARAALESAVSTAVWKAESPVPMEIDRAGQRIALEVAPARVCALTVELVGFDDVYALTEGEVIEITLGMMKRAKSDGQLALVVGHQLALALAARVAPQRYDADRAGLEFVHAANYDIAGAADFWRGLARNHPRAYARAPNQPVAMDRFSRLDGIVADILAVKDKKR